MRLDSLRNLIRYVFAIASRYVVLEAGGVGFDAFRRSRYKGFVAFLGAYLSPAQLYSRILGPSGYPSDLGLFLLTRTTT